MTQPRLQDLPGFLLAGGRSSRLGQEKARAFLCEDLSLIQAVHQSVEKACSSWIVVADEADKFVDLGLKTIADKTPHRGPMGGILRAAQAAGQRYFFVVSCDRVGLRAQWVELLKEALQKHEGAPAAAFFDQGRWEPLFGIYHGRLAPILKQRLAKKQGALWRLLQDIGALKVQAPPGWRQTFSVNYPADLERARKIWTAI